MLVSRGAARPEVSTGDVSLAFERRADGRLHLLGYTAPLQGKPAVYAFPAAAVPPPAVVAKHA